MSFTSRGWTNPTDQIQQELVDEVNWIVMKVGFCSKTSCNLHDNEVEFVKVGALIRILSVGKMR